MSGVESKSSRYTDADFCLPGLVTQLLQDRRFGIVVDPDDAESIQRALLQLVEEFRCGGIAPPAVDGAFHNYDGARLTRQLHDELLRCVTKNATAV
ncbi:hypothetical protein L0337_35255 [candidate division KSB1 bacterium]|nr:hypothetical protein [candidate division KSB1 bacterium]